MNQEYYIGQIFEGTYPPAAAVWCNANDAFIEKIADGKYEIKAQQEPTQEEEEHNIRIIRDFYLSFWDFSQLPDAPFTNEKKKSLALYRQYLRDYTKGGNWWKKAPLEYEDWEKESQ